MQDCVQKLHLRRKFFNIRAWKSIYTGHHEFCMKILTSWVMEPFCASNASSLHLSCSSSRDCINDPKSSVAINKEINSQRIDDALPASFWMPFEAQLLIRPSTGKYHDRMLVSFYLETGSSKVGNWRTLSTASIFLSTDVTSAESSCHANEECEHSLKLRLIQNVTDNDDVVPFGVSVAQQLPYESSSCGDRRPHSASQTCDSGDPVPTQKQVSMTRLSTIMGWWWPQPWSKETFWGLVFWNKWSFERWRSLSIWGRSFQLAYEY